MKVWLMIQRIRAQKVIVLTRRPVAATHQKPATATVMTSVLSVSCAARTESVIQIQHARRADIEEFIFTSMSGGSSILEESLEIRAMKTVTLM